MIDIDAEFRRQFGALTTSNEPAAPDEPLTVEMLREAARKLGPPPIPVRFSRHVPAMVLARPRAEAYTDDMRTMVEDMGPQMVSGGYHLKTQFGEMVVMNPVHKKEAK